MADSLVHLHFAIWILLCNLLLTLYCKPIRKWYVSTKYQFKYLVQLETARVNLLKLLTCQVNLTNYLIRIIIKSQYHINHIQYGSDYVHVFYNYILFLVYYVILPMCLILFFLYNIPDLFVNFIMDICSVMNQ